MSLFAFGVIVNTKRLQIVKTSYLEGDTTIEDEFTNFFLLLWLVVSHLASRYIPLPPQTQQYTGRK